MRIDELLVSINQLLGLSNGWCLAFKTLGAILATAVLLSIYSVMLEVSHHANDDDHQQPQAS